MTKAVEESVGESIPMERKLQIIENFRLMDDDFMSEVLDDNIEAVSLILRIVLERTDLTVTRVKTQNEYKSAAGRSVCLDVCAEDETGRIYDIEIQRSDHGSGVRRARVHSSMMDRTLLEKGQDFEEITDTYVIFITENDKFKRGLPLYHIERRVEELDYAPFDDGAHIIYVNGEYRDKEHPVGRLMHDFHCKHADDMVYPELAQTVRYYKESEGGRGQMCREMEALRKEGLAEGLAEGREAGLAEGREAGLAEGREAGLAEGREEAQIENAIKMLKLHLLTYEQIAECTGLTLDKVLELAGKTSEMENDKKA